MSIQSDVGRTLFDVRDVCKGKVTQRLVQLNESLNLNLTPQQIRDLSKSLENEIHTSFESGIDAVMRVF